jgi:hypothetical protein
MVAAAAALIVNAVPASAQESRKSPHETVKATVDGAQVSITYGRPYMKGRKIVGELVPYGKVWRTGADEATTLTTDKPLTVGGTKLEAGSYTLWTLPSESGWKLIINKQTGQWGTNYDETQDLARVDMKTSSTASPVEQFTIAINPEASGGATLEMQWETTAVSVPLSAK